MSDHSLSSQLCDHSHTLINILRNLMTFAIDFISRRAETCLEDSFRVFMSISPIKNTMSKNRRRPLREMFVEGTVTEDRRMAETARAK